MDIIRKFIPSNPLDANAQSTLKRIIADSMAIFVKNYAKATPVVLVQNKEAQIKYDEKMKAKREKRIAKNTKYLKRKLGDDAIIPEFPEPPQTENPTFDEMQSYCVSLNRRVHRLRGILPVPVSSPIQYYVPHQTGLSTLQVP